jgi:hypothetical protein
MNEDLRRITRVCVCCRVVVRDRYGVWTAVTEDISVRGCQIVTTRLLRCGTILELTLESDLFDEELAITGEVVWATPTRLGVAFVGSAGEALTPDAWLAKVIEHGAIPESSSTWRVAPSVLPAAARTVVRPIRRA